VVVGRLRQEFARIGQCAEANQLIFLTLACSRGSARQPKNASSISAIALLLAAVFPVVTAPLWHHQRARVWLLAIGWVIAVGCIMHALIDETIRLLSVAGVLHKDYPFFVPGSRDYHAADLQDILFNEPWFLLEGLLWGRYGGRISQLGGRVAGGWRARSSRSCC
jgi:hypothetical protein